MIKDDAIGKRDDTAPRNLSPVALDFLKFFGLAGIVGLFLAGYSYVDTFYDRFGLALHEVAIGYLETIEFVAFLLEDYRFILASIVVAVAFSASVAYVRFAFGDFGFYLSIAILFLLLSYLAVFGGSRVAHSYADNIILGNEGRKVYCELKYSADFHEDFRESFSKVTKSGRVRKIKETETMIYLFVVPESKPAEVQHQEPSHGESLEIQKNDISLCRVASGRSKRTQ